MSVVGRFDGDILVTGNVRLGADSVISPARPRESLELESEKAFPIPANQWFVFDSGQPLPATPASDDLGIVVGTPGTGTPVVSAGDVKNTASTRKARTLVRLPAEYVAGQTVKFNVSAATKTTVASVSCTVDLEIWKLDREGGVDGGDLCATSAQNINSTAFADKEFDVTATTLEPGDVLDVLLSIAYSDSLTGTAVTPTIGAVELLCDIRG